MLSSHPLVWWNWHFKSQKAKKSHPALRGLMETSWQSGANLPYFIWPDETKFIKAILSSDSGIRSLTIWIIFHLYGNKDPSPSPLSLPTALPPVVNCEGISWQGGLSGPPHFKALSALGRRRVREISGLQQNSALQEPQLDLTREFASKETECTVRCTENVWLGLGGCIWRRCWDFKCAAMNLHCPLDWESSDLCTFSTIAWLLLQEKKQGVEIASFM